MSKSYQINTDFEIIIIQLTIGGLVPTSPFMVVDQELDDLSRDFIASTNRTIYFFGLNKCKFIEMLSTIS